MSPYYTRRILTTSFINKFSLAKGKMKVSLVTQDRELEDRMLADYPGKIFGFQYKKEKPLFTDWAMVQSLE